MWNVWSESHKNKSGYTPKFYTIHHDDIFCIILFYSDFTVYLNHSIYKIAETCTKIDMQLSIHTVFVVQLVWHMWINVHTRSVCSDSVCRFGSVIWGASQPMKLSQIVALLLSCWPLLLSLHLSFTVSLFFPFSFPLSLSLSLTLQLLLSLPFSLTLFFSLRLSFSFFFPLALSFSLSQLILHLESVKTQRTQISSNYRNIAHNVCGTSKVCPATSYSNLN